MKMSTKKVNSSAKIKTAFSLSFDVVAKMQALADSIYGGNLSAAVEDAMQDRVDAASGPLSKVFAFNGEIRSMLRKLGLAFTHEDNAVDWLIPELSLGIESKVKFSSGKAETATVAALAYSIGQKLCNEILIVGPDTMTSEDRTQWERVAKDFHLCPVKFVLASGLEGELKKRMGIPPAAHEIIDHIKARTPRKNKAAQK